MTKINYLLLNTNTMNNIDNSNFRYDLKESIKIKSYFKINNLIMPRLDYTINDSNNSFKISFYQENGIFPYNIVLSNGKYSPLQIAASINTMIGSINDFNCTYNTQTYQFIFTSSIRFTLEFTSDFNVLLSLQKQVYATIMFLSNHQITSGIVILNLPNYICLNITNLQCNNVISNDNINKNFILPISSYNFSDIMIFNKKNNDMILNVNNQTINYLDIQIIDDTGLIFNNNNANFICCFEFDT